jgi:catechol 2,3-dioxygenase-like lactoylglutathione lyase family enzyme
MPDGAACASATPFDPDETRVIRPAMHHVNLKTTRLQDMIDWYGKVIGTRPNFQSDTIAFLANDDANHRIALTSPPGLKDDAEKVLRTGMHHTGYEYETLDDLLATYLRLKNDGILPGACLDHGTTLSFYYVDPDANMVELQADNYGDWEASTELMRNDEGFVGNPVGDFVDPEEIVAARRAGLTPWEIHERALRGEYPATLPIDFRVPLGSVAGTCRSSPPGS